MPDAPPDSTQSVLDAEYAARRATAHPCLFVVAVGGRPAGARHSLRGVEDVSLERGSARRAARGNDGRLTIAFDDATMSSRHARLVREGRAWVALDAGSKNGTRVAAAPVQRQTLADGDVLEMGGTFLLFQAAVESAPGEPTDLDAAQIRAHAPDLATLSPPLNRLFDRLPEIARSSLPVLVGGETGTGKEVVARAVHALSQRRGAFVPVNCGALPEALVESELFGYRKGAFSGATEDRQGLVRAADGGTLFLDEIGELRASSQAALLRVLQEREVHPLGASKAVPVDLRVVAASHRDLAGGAKREAFRADLLARLSGFHVLLPPLRRRREDLGMLVASLLARAGAPGGTTLTREAIRALLAHDWPHNVRELERRLAAALVLARGAAIEREHLFQPTGTEPADDADDGDADSSPVPDSPADRARRDEIVAVLRAHDGNVSAAARAMGKARFQLQRWIKRYRIDPAQCRRA